MPETDGDYRKEAQEAARNAFKDSITIDGTSIVRDFADGVLAVVEFTDQGKHEKCFVHFRGDQSNIYYDVVSLAQTVAARQRPTIWSMLLDPAKVGGIAGLIALLLTFTICYEFLHTQELKIPEVMTNSLTSIIGFYFGSQIQRRS